MFNLLLVDDEQNILDSMYYNIDWYGLEILEVFKAESARNALKILAENRIDLIVTDIRMPGMDGIEMGGEVRRHWPYAKIIILSGYRDFDYAQRAIGLKAFRYVVKPVRFEELRDIVEEAIVELKNDLKILSIIEEAQTKLAGIIPFLQDRFLHQWLEKDLVSPAGSGEALAECALDMRPDDIGFWITVKIDEWMQEPMGTGLISVALAELTKQVIGGECRTIHYVCLYGHNCFLFLSQDRQALDDYFKRTLGRLDTLQLSIRQTFGCVASIYWDFPHDMGDLSESYKSIICGIHQQSPSLPGAILGSSAILSHDHGVEMKSLKKNPPLGALVATLKTSIIMERIDEMIAELESDYPDSRYCFLQVYHTITGALITDSIKRGIYTNRWENEFTKYLEDVNNLASIAQLRTESIRIIDKYIDFVSKKYAAYGNKLVESIKRIVEDQLGEDLTVSKIASKMNYNANYLSRIFKAETSITLQDYIINLRIEKAKFMLLTGERIGDVSKMVGYDNSPHFSRIFKKIVGISPKQFQNNILQNS